MVLLLGLDNDLHLDAMVVELQRRGVPFVRASPLRMNRENTKITVRIEHEQHTTCIDTYSGSFVSDQVTAVWCRYAIEAMTAENENDLDRFADEEFLVLLKGALLQIPPERWVNDPFAEAKADNKPHQLTVATECGLRVPPTIISQSRDELERFADTHGHCVIKPIGDVPIIDDREGKPFGSFAALLDRSKLAESSWDESCPVMLQRYVDKRSDIRVTVIDGRVFSAALTHRSTEQRSVDFRNSVDLLTTQFVLPDSVQINLARMMTRLGVRYASCDFCIDQTGLYFLEANVAGNYLWTELEAGLPITSAIADVLMVPFS